MTEATACGLRIEFFQGVGRFGGRDNLVGSLLEHLRLPAGGDIQYGNEHFFKAACIARYGGPFKADDELTSIESVVYVIPFKSIPTFSNTDEFLHKA